MGGYDFSNAKIVIDRFRAARYCTEAVGNVRRSLHAFRARIFLAARKRPNI